MSRGEGNRGVKLDRVLLAILVALWVVTLGIMVIPEPHGSLGAAHPDLAGMRQGGSGLERHGPVLWAGWAFGAVGIVFYVALMAFGTRRGAPRRASARWLVVGLCTFLGAWTWLVAGHTLTAFLLGKRLRLFAGLADSISLPDAVAVRYSSETARLLTALAILLGVMGYLATQILAMATVLQSILEDVSLFAGISLEVCVALATSVLVFYCVTGGIVAPVYTDLVQGAIMAVAGVLVFLTTLSVVDGGLAGTTTLTCRSPMASTGVRFPCSCLWVSFSASLSPRTRRACPGRSRRSWTSECPGGECDTGLISGRKEE
jgi:Na+/proline symporter